MPDPWTLNAARPIVLLPVRLETRYAGSELLVRIYPDHLHIDSHEPELTPEETTAGKRYWERVWRAGPDGAREQAAWDELAAWLGAPRAAWVARVLEPRNPADRPKRTLTDAEALTPAPTIPDPPGHAQPWTRPPLARALPTRWRVVATLAGTPPVRREIISKDVQRPLVAGPSPGFDPTQLPDDQPPVDAAAKWMVDFAAAELAGMAVRIPDVPADGVARLLVFGVDEALDDVRSAQVLDDLLEAQYHTRGLAFVPRGTPTNNTGNVTAGYDSRATVDRVALAHAVPTDTDADAKVLAGALGLSLTARAGTPVVAGSAGALGRARHATRRQEAASRAMNTTLWATTFGYFLGQMMAPTFPDAEVQRARRHFVDHVRGGGPLPALRIGDQPYGVLPVLAFDQWTDREGGALGAPVVNFLKRMRSQVWQPSVATLPQVRPGASGAQTALVNVLGMAPTAQHYAARTLLGTDYLAYLWRFIDDFEMAPDWRAQLRAAAVALRERLGFAAWDPRVGRAVFSADSFRVRGPLVSGAEQPATYLARLGDIATAIDTVKAAETVGSPTTTPLLYRLVRHALLVEHAIAAMRVQGTASGDHLERELVDILPGPPTPTLWRQLDRQVSTPAGPMVLRDYLRGPADDPPLRDLREFRAATAALASESAADLERLMAETLDLASHRLDAWITSFATRRLRWLRQQAPSGGAYVGAYGWLLDIKRRTPREPVTTPPAGESATGLSTQPGNAGYVHAPSLAQATTAAVLRAAHTATPPEDGRRGQLAIELTSARVRLASWLLDGVRQGQPLGALLGYRLERDLHDRGLAVHISALRELAPLRSARLTASGAEEAVPAMNVVNGLALQRLWRDGTNVNAAVGAAAGTLDAPLQALDDAIDALGDALLAEGVHQAVQGNPTRAAASLDAAARGDAPPPELEFVRTPRTGQAVTHRVAALLYGTTVSAVDWPVDGDLQVRGPAEPRLNAWASRLLPIPRRVRVRARALGAAEADVVRSDLDLSGLRLSPLDYVMLAERDEQAGLAELELRILDHVRSLPLVGPDARVRLDYTRAPEWPADAVTVPELLEQARAVRRLFTAARPLRAADLQPPDRGVSEAAGPTVTARATAVVAALEKALTELADPMRRRTGLLRAAALGVPGAYPRPSDLARQSAAILAALQTRKAAVAKAGDDLARLREVLGPDFRVLPEVPTPAGEVASAFAASTDCQGGDRLACVDWLLDAGRVRQGVERLTGVLQYAEALGAGDTLTAMVGQLPFKAGERWLGLKLGLGSPAGGRLSVVAHTPTALPTSGTIFGLLIDEWTEVIPHGEETTGLAFHFDAPDACAPQAILLAVSPDARATWSPELLEATVAEALDLAQLRMVDLEALHPLDPNPNALTDVGQYLPALYFATNVADDTVSTDFARGSAG